MTKKTLINLLLLSLLLFVLYWVSYSDTSTSKQAGQRELLLSHVNWNTLKSIVLEKDGDQIELASDTSGAWTLPSRNGYAASTSSIRSFLLKLMDLSSSQSIKSTEEGIQKLGLSEEGGQGAKGSIALKDASGKEIEKVFLGALRNRKNETDENLMSLSGQYVRLESKPSVFLIPLPLSFQTDAGAWIDKGILQIEQNKIYFVQAFEITDGEEKEIYSLTRRSHILTDGEPEFVFSVTPPSGKEIAQTIIRQSTMALEDLKADDVHAAGTETVKDFSPQRYVVYALTDGSVYTISTQDHDGAYFLKIALKKDPVLVQKLEKKFQEEEAHNAAMKALADDSKKALEEDDSEKDENEVDSLEGKEAKKENPKDPVPVETPEEKRVLTIVEDERVNSDSAEYEKWIYVVPDFVGKKFIKDVDAFFKEIPQEESEALEG
jgi:hypothetical protein